MKIKPTVFLLAIIVALIAVSCVTKNPAHDKDASQPAYVVDPKVEQTHQAVKGVSDAAAPFNPYSALTSPAMEAVFGLITAASLLFAKKKNTQAAQSDSAANTIAAGAAKQGPTVTAAIMDHASDQPHFDKVASLLNKNTPEGTAP